ncbi:CotS family spore coat protein [Clostridium chauvoei]|uniref:CotS family spore coat protein n=2 Tax=Clostridium chauvoei TaxID=46867 RepID=A0ABD4RJK1_9CLOT|nr:CotS family spore coat protein [Clostridium chauvoei]ATD55958.1 spore coat protein [Clostridium chauvoei]ATD56371.1 spore coat protein [Clostridium chauvoei]MBX7281577.1 CotS family spore coat protein [Clostridium chauvoei]MBX7284084.1 CotS family spore coat protein [Clostridium chauvoei]MBX7286625.1 CotS family spore coat protein [Clostridium chauvoei]
MNFLDVKNVIEDNYSLNVIDIEKVKNTYKVKAEEGIYGVKVVKYEYPHFYFIFSAIKHLQNRNFNKIPEIIKTNDRLDFIKLGNNYAYLNEWIPSRSTKYDDLFELSKVAEKLGELHKCSEGFSLDISMKPRIGWYSWIHVFETRCEEILDFKKRISQKAYKSEFDSLYLEAVNSEIERGRSAILSLKENKYIEMMDKEVCKRGFCHHDFANHNVLLDEESNINIIDFDYCILDSHLHDLSSLLIRAMKGGKWSIEKANLILESYSKTHDLYEDELKLMKGFIEFPQGFWQIGLQYYWEQQPWGEEFMVNKINKYLSDRENREKFIEEFF